MTDSEGKLGEGRSRHVQNTFFNDRIWCPPKYGVRSRQQVSVNIFNEPGKTDIAADIHLQICGSGGESGQEGAKR